jgi:RNA polymerase sigma-70 factor (ECF subfamily)
MSDHDHEQARRRLAEHRRRLVRQLERAFGRREFAEDVAQEAFLKIRNQYGQDDENLPYTLLWRVAVRTAIDKLRQTRNRAEVPTDPDTTTAPRAWEPDWAAMEGERRRELSDAIESLSPPLRRAVSMRYLLGMPRQEIADELGISVNAVEQRLTRALKILETAISVRDLIDRDPD